MRDAGERTPLSVYGYDDEYQALHVCSACFELYEVGRLDDMNQACACRPSDVKWPGFDYNQRAMLCRCCGFTVLRSGSRWSPYFCRECQLLATGVSVWHRELVFPVGRHSLMHSWVPTTPSASLSSHGGNVNALATGVYRTARSVARGSDGLWDWYRTIMPRNLRTFEIAGDVSLHAYIDAVATRAPGLSSRVEAFNGLCQFFQSGYQSLSPGV